MDILRTPDECFQGLPGYDFAPRYAEVPFGERVLRVHYLDEGPRDAAETVAMLHGEPSWSFFIVR